MSEKEKKYRKIGWVSAISVQLVMLLIFYFLIAWKEPFPPIPSYGVELSLGFEETGSGDEPASTEAEPTETDDQPVEEPADEAADQVDEVSEEVAEEIIEEESSTPTEAEEVPLTNEPSPDVVDEEVEPEVVSPEESETTVEQEETPEEESAETTTEEVSELNPEATMPESTKEESGAGTTSEEGNEGTEEGTIDGRALMGEQGDTEGASLQMAGWIWDVQPSPQDTSNEEGKIVYKIVIDQDGYIIGIELQSSTVSPVVERYYRQSVERLSFSKTSDYQSAPTSTGTITFIIKAR